jgi:hypothetical protein
VRVRIGGCGFQYCDGGADFGRWPVSDHPDSQICEKFADDLRVPDIAGLMIRMKKS